MTARASRASDLTVVKVGGSYATFPRLADVAAALAAGGGRTIVVPGGGPFADLVRSEQQRLGFDDAAAHRMALLAMAQFGQLLASFSDALVPAPSRAAIGDALTAGKVPVWQPLDILDGVPELPENWDLTSDSLAAWLAGQIGATRLVFLKRGSAPTSARLDDLVEARIVDPLLPRFVSPGTEVRVCSEDDLAMLGAALASGNPWGSAGRSRDPAQPG